MFLINTWLIKIAQRNFLDVNWLLYVSSTALSIYSRVINLPSD